MNFALYLDYDLYQFFNYLCGFIQLYTDTKKNLTWMSLLS